MLSIVIISLVSLISDIILSNFLPFMVNDLSLFTPMFTVITVFLIYPLFAGDIKKYFIYSFILGVVYDILLTNLFLYDAFIFLFLAFLTHYMYKNLEVTFIRSILYIALMITLYETIFGIFIVIFNLVPISMEKLYYKISHSLILNIIYGEIIYLIVKRLTKTTNRRKINLFK